MNTITITKAQQLKVKPTDESTLGHGNYFTDHMFAMNYTPTQGWHDARIVPYAPIPLDPSTSCLHYGQLIFEGMKAYRADDGRVLLFRPERNIRRFNSSCERLCIPQIDEGLMLSALEKLVYLEKDWVPHTPGTALYIRPFILGTDNALGVRPSKEYLMLIIVSPVGHYFPEGLSPIRIFVEDEYVRAVKGGVGSIKCAGNYAASMAAQVKAQKVGCSQVLWLDGYEHKYVEEVGQMNAFFIIDGKACTPMLSGSILQGVTRDSVITLLKSWDIPVEERRISVQELADAAANGTLEEAFGCGTAAVIAPIKELIWGDIVMRVGDGNTGSVTKRLYDTLIGIQRGALTDSFNWSHEVN